MELNPERNVIIQDVLGLPKKTIERKDVLPWISKTVDVSQLDLLARCQVFDKSGTIQLVNYGPLWLHGDASPDLKRANYIPVAITMKLSGGTSGGIYLNPVLVDDRDNIAEFSRVIQWSKDYSPNGVLYSGMAAGYSVVTFRLDNLTVVPPHWNIGILCSYKGSGTGLATAADYVARLWAIEL